MHDFIVLSLEQGLIFGVLVLGVFITYRVLDFPDLTVDGSFPLGAAVSARLILEGVSPFWSLLWALAAGIAAGFCTALLHTKFKISNLLSGILVMIALYSINLRVMGRANIPLLGQPTIFRQFELICPYYAKLILLLCITLLIKFTLDLLFKTHLGLALRAGGNNQQMVTSLNINPHKMIFLGLALANGLASLSGALVAQLQGFADVGMGIGTIITGLASVIIGEAIFPNSKFAFKTTAVLCGSIFYRGMIRASLTLGLAPTDLKLMTSLLVIVALIFPHIKLNKFTLRYKGGNESC